jgi:hypothetical protein
MAKDAFDDLRRSQEEKYFHEKEQELIKKLRLTTEGKAQRQDMGESLGIANEAILQNLQDLGYNRDTIKLLHLVPLLYVAWADGEVSKKEKDLILELAQTRNITSESEAYRQLNEWLNERPSEVFMEETLRLLNAILGALPEADQQSNKNDLLSYCTRVAQASGGLLGFGKMSEEERARIATITAELANNHSDAAEKFNS